MYITSMYKCFIVDIYNVIGRRCMCVTVDIYNIIAVDVWLVFFDYHLQSTTNVIVD